MNIGSLKASIIVANWIFSFFFQHHCYAETVKEKVKIPCSPSMAEARPHLYPGIIGYKKLLTSKGIKKRGQKELLVNNSDPFIYVVAECFDIDDLGELTSKTLDVFFKLESTLPKLECGEGEGIKIIFKSPNSDNPREYQYIGEILTFKEQELKYGKLPARNFIEAEYRTRYRRSSSVSSLSSLNSLELNIP